MYNHLELDFNRLELIDKLKENREAHKAEYAEAMKGYFMEIDEQADFLLEQMQEVKELASKGELPEDKEDFNKTFYLKATRPFSYEKDYDRAIAMLEMAKSDEVELDEQGFARYVLDEWDWKDDFASTNSVYLSKTRR